jgi:hypothetical protein
MALAATEAGLDQTQGVDMDPKSGKPPLVFVNPFAIWTELALKTGEAIMASMQAATGPRTVGVVPPADAPAPKDRGPVAKRTRKASQATASKSRGKTRGKAKAKAKTRHESSDPARRTKRRR